MPTENQYASSEDVERVQFPKIAVAAFGAGTGQTGPGNQEPVSTSTTPQPNALGNALGDLLLQQLKGGTGSGNIGTEETPIAIPSTGPNAVVIVLLITAAIAIVWLLTRKRREHGTAGT